MLTRLVTLSFDRQFVRKILFEAFGSFVAGVFSLLLKQFT